MYNQYDNVIFKRTTDYHENANLTAPQAPKVLVSKLSHVFNYYGPGYPPNFPVSEIEEYGKTIPVGQIVFRPFFTQMAQCVHLALLRFFEPKFMTGGRR